MISGGIIGEISYSNPTVGSGFFNGYEGETGTYILGGLINAADPGINGAGVLIVTKQLVPGSIEMPVSNDMSADVPDLERLWALSASLDDTTWTWASTNGEVYKGVGSPVDIPSLDGSKAMFTLKVSSGAGWVKQ